MNHQYYNVLGVMSGTSLDGIDIAHVTLVRKDRWSFQIHTTETFPYSAAMKQKLKDAIHGDNTSISSLNKEYTTYLAENINRFIKKNDITNLLAVCSHGHTIFHQPSKGLTLQIGNLPELASLINKRLICDFRVQDVALKGQGAPLVPIGDQLLFGDYDYCLNLGGFANLSFSDNDIRIAFDICPVNVVLNHYALKLGKEYDAGGAFAKAGTIQTSILKNLNRLEFYNLEAPKSLGLEWVNENIFEILDCITNNYDIIATFTEHVAIQISKQIKDNSSVLITGGGAFNSYLINRIKKLSSARIVIPDDKIVENKEALIFAFLGVLKLRNENNCLASVTGATQDHSSGRIYVP
ncbi:anhydro-N-acetylmuramic acid kinase [Nonlabens dokdonensis]|uniref:Anhydro-N-acetylmuramic acid kinase n=2 Tax=Nonlabens dokdonensis TaxID=328515 RepID=L7W5W7_NONDD|nr:anhydro-N-acetylmuramic acid kinase [Nonlabens dokdonensis]AGC77065.1 anhydro-N-acetylmuramic acid kinase [Nonlabens dokdonensis DSW-6]PZX41026.1 anhydro-N-acetylmuramic acid kinase [Nonlabens dokdonensis]